MRSLITNQLEHDAWFEFFNYVRAVEKDQASPANKKTPKRLQEIKGIKKIKSNHEQAVHVVNAVLAINHVKRG